MSRDTEGVLALWRQGRDHIEGSPYNNMGSALSETGRAAAELAMRLAFRNSGLTYQLYLNADDYPNDKRINELAMRNGATVLAVKAPIERLTDLRISLLSNLVEANRVIAAMVDRRIGRPLDEIYLKHVGALHVPLGSAIHLPTATKDLLLS